MEIKGKTALVLGAARGIGKAVALALARSGATVVATCFDWPEDAVRTRDELAAMGKQHQVMHVDLRSREQVINMFREIDERFGCLHILINNIERGGMPVVHGDYSREINKDQWDLELDTTMTAKWLVFREALPLLKKVDSGAVVTLSSMAGIVGRTGPAGLLFNDGYSAANRAVSSFTKSWARQAAPAIRVNELMLGLVETRHAQGTKGWDILTAKEKKSLLDHTLLGRTATVDEVVDAVMFLVAGATFMTGGILLMDGGYVLGGEKVPEMPAGIL